MTESTGDVLFHRVDEATVTATVADGTLVAYSDRAPIKEASDVNEDGAMWRSWGARGVLAIADGAGGMPNGDLASRAALEALRETVETVLASGRLLRDAVLDGIDAANRAVIALDGAACTIAVVSIEADVARIYHAGDSPVLVVDRLGNIRHRTIDHTPLGYAFEAGVFDEEEAIAHEARHIISNMLGGDEMRVELSSPIVLAPGDTVLLASDGLFDNLYLGEIAGVARGPELDGVAATLAATARARMNGEEPEAPSKPDDLTFILYRREAT